MKSSQPVYKKRWRVKPGRLLTNLLFLLCLVLFVLFLLHFTAGQSRGVVEEEFVDILVKQGDSLWTIARVFYPDRDPRRMVSVIRHLNGLQSDPTIFPGQVLKIPKHQAGVLPALLN